MDSRIIRILALFFTVVFVAFQLVGCIVSAPGKVVYTDKNRDPSLGRYTGKIDRIRLLEVNQNGYVLEVHYSGIRYPHGVFIRTEAYGPSGLWKGYRSNPYPIRSNKGKARVQVYYRGRNQAHGRPEPTRIVAKLYRGEDPDVHFAVSKLKIKKHQRAREKASSPKSGVAKTIDHRNSNKKAGSATVTTEKSSVSPAKKEKTGPPIKKSGSKVAKGKTDTKKEKAGSSTKKSGSKVAKGKTDTKKEKAGSSTKKSGSKVAKGKADSKSLPAVAQSRSAESADSDSQTAEPSSGNPAKQEKTGSSTKKTGSKVAKGKADSKSLPAVAQSRSAESADSDSQTADPSSDDPAKKAKNGSSTNKK